MTFPKHISLDLEHNEHNLAHQSVRDWINEDLMSPLKAAWSTEDEIQKAIDTNELWVMHWYPISPLTFRRIAASTLDALLDFAQKVEAKQ